MGKGFFQNINESNRGLLGTFSQVIRNGLIDIQASQRAWDNWLGLHVLESACAAWRTRLRKDSK